MSTNTRDMTQGKPSALLLSFAIPLMLGNVFQQLYTIVDTMVVGQFVGVEALAALGAVEWIHWLVFSIITGAAQGFSILTAQRFGAEDAQGLCKSVALSTLLCGVLAAVATVISIPLAKPVLLFLNTPAAIMDDALTYLIIAFSGMLAVAGYNVFASTLRAMGNSRAPLVAMIVAAGVNITLDLLFVVVFHWGVAGAAFATVIAEVCACLFCYLVVRRIPALALTRAHFKPDSAVIRRLLLLGAPTAFQNVVISVGGMTVQYVINGFGFLFVAGFTATNKLYGLLEVAATSFGFSVATYTGQNLGAGQYRRIRYGVRCGAWMAVATSLVISAVMFLFGRRMLALFISGDAGTVGAVLDIAQRYLWMMSAALSVLYLLYVFRSALQGMGDAVTPMLSGLVEMAMRTAIVLLLPLAIGQDGVYYAEIAAWVGALVLLFIVYTRRARRLPAEDRVKNAAGADRME